MVPLCRNNISISKEVKDAPESSSGEEILNSQFKRHMRTKDINGAP